MKPYPEYRDSGIEWIGEIPFEWNLIRLKYVLSLVTNRANDNHVTKVALENIKSWTGELVESSSQFQGDGILFENGDILFGKLRPYLAKVWRAYFSGSAVGDIFVLRPNASVFSNFASYRMVSAQFIHVINGSTFGAKMPRASWDFIGNLPFPVPSLPEQKQIAKYLDHKTSKIDRLIEKKKRLIELLKEERTAVINQAVTKGLDPDAPMKDSEIDWLGEIPAHWEVTKLKYLANVRYGLGQPPKQLENGLPIIRATNISRGKITKKNLMFVDPDDVPYDRDPLLRTNDIIVVRSGAYTADSAIITREFDGAITGYDMVVRSVKCNPNLIAFALLSNYVLENQLMPLSLRAAQPHLNAEELGNANILKPPQPEEQMTIVRHIEQETSRIDSIISKSENEIELLQEYRTALISEVVTGKIDVREEKI